MGIQNDVTLIASDPSTSMFWKKGRDQAPTPIKNMELNEKKLHPLSGYREPLGAAYYKEGRGKNGKGKAVFDKELVNQVFLSQTRPGDRRTSLQQVRPCFCCRNVNDLFQPGAAKMMY